MKINILGLEAAGYSVGFNGHFAYEVQINGKRVDSLGNFTSREAAWSAADQHLIDNP